MFSGIVESTGIVKKVADCNGDKQFLLSTEQSFMSDIKTGESICVNGVCLTVVGLDSQGFTTDVSRETLSCTTLTDLEIGDKVNLEKALQLNSRLNGHMVTGHVDGVGIVKQRVSDARSERFIITIPENLHQYICKKGSICVDGVSLTVNDVTTSTFSVNIIPHTLEATIFAQTVVDDRVNIEVDMIARYLESLSSSYK